MIANQDSSTTARWYGGVGSDAMKDRRLPWILVNGEHGPEANGTVKLARRYQRAIERAGGLPVVLPWIDDFALLDELLEHVDGVLLTGGDDFDTEALGLGPTHPAAQPVPESKQTLDFELARRVLDRGIPTLGICYGMQLLALAEGASFIQDLRSERQGAQEHRGGVEHPVRIQSGTKLAGMVGLEPLSVVSRHHQAIDHPGDGWEITARDEEGLVEALERCDHPFAIGVQWHPELSPGTAHDHLFDGLIAAARAHRLTAAR